MIIGKYGGEKEEEKVVGEEREKGKGKGEQGAMGIEGGVDGSIYQVKTPLRFANHFSWIFKFRILTTEFDF